MDTYKHLDERYNKIHLMVCIVAAAAVITACIIRGENLFTMALLASVAIVVFYVLGNLVRYYIVTRVFPPPPEEEEATGEESPADSGEENPDEETAGASAAPEPPAPGAHDYLSRE
jgi:flagellar biosynthesis/type III secretory pathway M-ring protein FliF/YscJ